ncbi:hypothetical protein BD309DRAFT_47459 [Dichomitus squalens]|uniref:Uncharacterized protein n=1 Tax=Dichomitus squalens TaxID=114155 RepID=A0A4Q9PZ77_9APHY|nr:hypothetical protein BD309DRAFT_47459 [Dichomitus squalens]TBU60127.1 hypothetical protein BD310DRAFT_348445 [Dichomitus squalens]
MDTHLHTLSANRLSHFIFTAKVVHFSLTFVSHALYLVGCCASISTVQDLQARLASCGHLVVALCRSFIPSLLVYTNLVDNTNTDGRVPATATSPPHKSIGDQRWTESLGREVCVRVHNVILQLVQSRLC